MFKTKFRVTAIVSLLLLMTASCSDPDPTTLIEISVPADYYAVDETTFAIAYDVNGKLLDYARLENGATIRLKSNERQLFTLAFVNTSSNDSENAYGESYHYMPIGTKVSLSSSFSDDGAEHPETGYFEVTFDDFPSDMFYGYVSSNAAHTSYISRTYNVGTFLSKGTQSRLFMQAYDYDHKLIGYSFPAQQFERNSTSTVSFNSLQPYIKQRVPFPDDQYWSSATVWMYGFDEGTSDRYEVSYNYGEGSIELSYPGLEEYASDSYLSGYDRTHFAHSNSKAYDFERVENEVDATYSGSTVSYQAANNSGVLIFEFEKEVGQHEFEWIMFSNPARVAGGGSATLTVPVLPQEIIDEVNLPQGGEWLGGGDVVIANFGSKSSISDFLQLNYGTDEEIEAQDYKIYSESIPVNGVRQRNSNDFPEKGNNLWTAVASKMKKMKAAERTSFNTMH